MAQAGNLVVLGDAGEALGDSIYEARLFVRGKVKSLGADCIEKAMRDEHKRALHELLGRGRRQRRGRRSASSGATARPASSTISTSTTPEPTDGLRRPRTARRRASRRPSTTTRCRRSAAPPRPASTTSAAPAPSASCRISTTCCSSAPRSAAIRSKAIARSCGTDVVLGTRFAKKPIHAQDPDHHRRHELRLAVGAGQGGARAAAPRRSAPRPPPATAA